MAIVYATALKNTRMNAVTAAIDAGSGPGKLKLFTAGDVLLSTIALNDPSFGSASGGTITLAGTPLSDLDAAATGIPTKATLTDSDDNVIVSGLTVGTSGTHIILAAAEIEQHDEVRINSGTLSHG